MTKQQLIEKYQHRVGNIKAWITYHEPTIHPTAIHEAQKELLIYETFIKELEELP